MLTIIRAIIIVLLTVQIGLMAALILYIIRAKRAERRSKELEARWQPLLYEYLEDEVDIKTMEIELAENYNSMWNFFRPYLDNLIGSDREKIEKLLQEIGFIAHFRQQLNSENRSKRIRAAVVLGKVRDSVSLPQLEEMLQSDSTYEIIIAGQAITDIGATELVFEIMAAFLQRTNITFEGISQIIINYGEEICPPLITILTDWLAGRVDLEEKFQVPAYQSAALFVELLGHSRYQEALPVFEKILQQRENEELLIQVLKALSRLKEPVQIDLKPFLTHENRVIRNQTLKYLYKCCQPGYEEQIVGLLADENWWVSFYAAMLLYHNGRQNILTEIAGSAEQGAAMSSYILEAGGQFEHF